MSNENEMTTEEQIDFLRKNIGEIVEFATKVKHFFPMLCTALEEYQNNVTKYQIQDEDIVHIGNFVKEQLIPTMEKVRELALKHDNSEVANG